MTGKREIQMDGNESYLYGKVYVTMLDLGYCLNFYYEVLSEFIALEHESITGLRLLNYSTL